MVKFSRTSTKCIGVRFIGCYKKHNQCVFVKSKMMNALQKPSKGSESCRWTCWEECYRHGFIFQVLHV